MFCLCVLLIAVLDLSLQVLSDLLNGILLHSLYLSEVSLECLDLLVEILANLLLGLLGDVVLLPSNLLLKDLQTF